MRTNPFKRVKTQPDEIVRQYLHYVHGRFLIIESEMDNLIYDTSDTGNTGVGDDKNGNKRNGKFVDKTTEEPNRGNLPR